MRERDEPGAARPEGPGAARPEGLDARTPTARLADHAEIERLASDLLPALVARLAGTGLGELEVREGDWRVRLRRPSTAERRPTDRPGRSVRPATRDGGRAGSAPGHDPAAPAPAPRDEAAGATRRTPLVATSPAVGIFRARPEVKTGSRVKAGERVGVVDLLGVPQDVLAPGEAVVAALFVEDGDAVEYGQALIALEPIGPGEHEPAPQAGAVG